MEMSAQAWYDEGIQLRRENRLPEALQRMERSIAADPRPASAHGERGVLLRLLGRPAEALASLDHAISLAPNDWTLHVNRANVLSDLRQHDAAIAACDRALAIRPHSAPALVNRGIFLNTLGLVRSALESLAQAVAIDPHSADAHWSYALCLLRSGNMAAGWREYEWRLQHPHWGRTARRDFAQPLWTGAEPIEGKTVLLHAEQGLGDMLQFCRYARYVQALGARVVLEVPAPLAELLADLPGTSQVVRYGAALPPFDAHIAMLSLPHALWSGLDTIPWDGPYVSAPAAHVHHWTELLGPRRALRVGLAWSGNPQHVGDQSRSIALAELLTALPIGPEYISLQPQVRATDADALAGQSVGLRHFGDELRDFRDTAALCELVDIVVSVDTSVAHLAGAMGRPLWLLVAFDADWRWLAEGESTDWYPQARLYRQPWAADWTPVFRRLRADLETQCHGARTAPAARPT
jgi:tetratricopeptide (TPR) repeat protein